MKNLFLLLTLLFSTTGLAATTQTYSNQINNAFFESLATTATAAGTTTLTASSASVQIFTGSTTQTVVMADATTLQVGRAIKIINESTGIVIVNKNGGSLIATISPGNSKVFVVSNNGSAAGGWSIQATTAPITAITPNPLPTAKYTAGPALTADGNLTIGERDVQAGFFDIGPTPSPSPTSTQSAQSTYRRPTFNDFALTAGSVWSSATTALRIEAAFVANNGSAASITDGNTGGWLTSVTRGGAGLINWVMPAGVWSSRPWCTCSTLGAANSNTYCTFNDGVSTTGFTTLVRDPAGTGTDDDIMILCIGFR